MDFSKLKANGAVESFNYGSYEILRRPDGTWYNIGKMRMNGEGRKAYTYVEIEQDSRELLEQYYELNLKGKQ